jgi:hypothetical protein
MFAEHGLIQPGHSGVEAVQDALLVWNRGPHIVAPRPASSCGERWDDVVNKAMCWRVRIRQAQLLAIPTPPGQGHNALAIDRLTLGAEKKKGLDGLGLAVGELERQ